KALLKEFNLASSSGRKMTDDERMKFVGETYRVRYAMAKKFLDLAEKNRTDPIAFDALSQATWQVNTMWPVELVGEDPARGRAFELLLSDHVTSDKLAPLCQRISYGFAPEYETFLRAVAEKNPHKSARAIASVSLAHYLNNRVQRIDLCKEQPAQAKE